jgi:uncharacterized protein YjbI with pentapeptide repeats
MANQEHLDILKQGVDVWNRWREEHPEILPDLSQAFLEGADLHKINLFNANLIEVNLSRANLNEADLFGTNLCGANLSHAILFRTELNDAYPKEANLSEAYLVTTVALLNLNKRLPQHR